MIGRLTGRLLERSPDRVVIDIGGVGYDVRIPLSTFYRLSPAGAPQPVSLHVHTHVREDALQLFGFATPSEREIFELLIAISGIGPRIALAFLSGIGVDELREAVVTGDRDRLCRIPGVGKKTAERVLLELRDKLGLPEEAKATHAVPADGPAPTGVSDDAVSALVNLGYGVSVAEKAVARALGDGEEDPGLEDVLKRSLRNLVR